MVGWGELQLQYMEIKPMSSLHLPHREASCICCDDYTGKDGQIKTRMARSGVSGFCFILQNLPCAQEQDLICQ